MKLGEILARAKSAVANSKARYKLGMGGMNPARPLPENADGLCDCSGFVSWCWQIPTDPRTAQYVKDRTGDNGWHTVDIAQLTAGDAVLLWGPGATRAPC